MLRIYLLYSLGAFLTHPLQAQDDYHRELAAQFAYGSVQLGEEEMPYRYFVPASYDPDKKYPLVLTLHGSGESGSDNDRQISRNFLSVVWADAERQLARPCFVLSPQAPVGEFEAFLKLDEMIETAMDDLIATYAIDTNRIYITGLSMGGNGAYDLLKRFPVMRMRYMVNSDWWLKTRQAMPSMSSVSKGLVSTIQAKMEVLW